MAFIRTSSVLPHHQNCPPAVVKGKKLDIAGTMLIQQWLNMTPIKGTRWVYFPKHKRFLIQSIGAT